MSVNIIDTLKPKGNGSFPVVEASDVSVSAGLRLPEALGAKANAADVSAATTELHGEINQIVISASAEAVVAPEVAQARVDDGGTSFSTLKERLDSDAQKGEETSKHITISTGCDFHDFVNGKYILTNVTVGETVDLTPVTNSAFCYAMFDCAAGDKITVKLKGWTNARLWAFVNSSNVLLSKSNASVDASSTPVTITAPEHASKCIVGGYIGEGTYVHTGLTVDDKIGTVSDQISTISDTVTDIASSTAALEESQIILTNGSVNENTGQIDVYTWRLRTPIFVPVEEFGKIYKSIGYRAHCAVYSQESVSSRVGGFYASQNVVYSKDDLGAHLKTTYPAAKYCILSFDKYEEGSAVEATFDEYLSDGNILEYNNAARYNNIANTVEKIETERKSFDLSIHNKIFTSDFSFTIPAAYEFGKNVIITIDAVNTTANDTQCSIEAVKRWRNGTDTATNAYFTIKYPIGGKNRRTHNQFRLPCGIEGMSDFTVTLKVPDGNSLTVNSLLVDFSNEITRESAVNLNAHGKNGFGGPANTMVSFAMAAKLGYKRCITIPKVTKDGIYVCFHDDESIQDALRNPDGSEIAEEYQDLPISEFTYEQLMQFDAGVIRGRIFAGEKVPKLEDFFKLCAKTGMYPMLSVHPSLEGHWGNIKAMAKKYGVLDRLGIKAGAGASLEAPMSVLENDVESYTLDINSDIDGVEYMDYVVDTYDIDRSKVRVGIEYFNAFITDSRIENALANGYFVSAANITTDVVNRYKELIEKGVTEFTDDYVASSGLSW